MFMYHTVPEILTPAAIITLMWSYDPASYAGGSVAAGRVSRAGQVKGDDPDKKGYPGPPGSCLVVGLRTPPRKKL
jgi:hypothetical protein